MPEVGVALATAASLATTHAVHRPSAATALAHDLEVAVADVIAVHLRAAEAGVLAQEAQTASIDTYRALEHLELQRHLLLQPAHQPARPTTGNAMIVDLASGTIVATARVGAIDHASMIGGKGEGQVGVIASMIRIGIYLVVVLRLMRRLWRRRRGVGVEIGIGIGIGGGG